MDSPEFSLKRPVGTQDGLPGYSMGSIDKIRYSHDAMIDMLIAEPSISQVVLAARFGYTPAWVSNIMASDVFQARLAERRKELIDPTLVATIEERFRGLTLLSLKRLEEKLEAPQVSDMVVLKALELGAKAIAVGGNAPPRLIPVDLQELKGRLLHLHSEVTRPQALPITIEGER